MKTSLFLVSSVMALVACGPGDRDGKGDDDGSGSGSGSGEMKRCNKIDLVFVVDNSGSMSQEQDNLADNFPNFATLLDNYVNDDGDKIDYRIAVTTTSRDLRFTTQLPGGGSFVTNETGDNGAFRNTCGLTKRWLEPVDPNMPTTLSCRAKVGTDNPGAAEMPLLMPKYALSERVQDGTNANFLRDDALLAVVTLTDENDSSTTQNNFTLGPFDEFPLDWNPEDLVQFYDTVKGHRSRWASAMIAGDGDCKSAFGDAKDAGRLKEFVNQANSQGTTQAVFSSICAGDLTIGLQQALDLFQEACGGIIL
jgi:hypothetical protein